MSASRRIHVFKVGGALIEDPARLESFLDAFCAVSGRKVLVHGGGRSATDLCAKLGIPTTMVQGRRVTDADTLRVVTMVYAGAVNKQIVSGLGKRGTKAIGVCGADLGIIKSHRRPPVVVEGLEVDFGYVGDIDSVDVEALRFLIDLDAVPVVCPLTYDGSGLLNTNADSVASVIATALSNSGEDTSLVFCFEKKGVLMDPGDENSLIAHLTPERAQKLISEGVIAGGMVPKVTGALSALSKGVSSVYITSSEDFFGGTEFSLGQ